MVIAGDGNGNGYLPTLSLNRNRGWRKRRNVHSVIKLELSDAMRERKRKPCRVQTKKMKIYLSPREKLMQRKMMKTETLRMLQCGTRVETRVMV